LKDCVSPARDKAGPGAVLRNRQGPHRGAIARGAELLRRLNPRGRAPWRGSGISPLQAPQKEPGDRAKPNKNADKSKRSGGTDAYPALLQGHQNR
jgi:hypothetical protein